MFAILKFWTFWLLLFLQRIFMIGGFFGLMTFPVSYDLAALVVRFSVAAAMLPHGIEKCLDRSGARPFPGGLLFSSRSGFTVVMLIEILTPIFLALGLCVRLAVIPAFVGACIAVWKSRGRRWTTPALPLTFGLLAVFFIGSGQYSLDAILGAMAER